jgi:hypothetical protein
MRGVNNDLLIKIDRPDLRGSHKIARAFVLVYVPLPDSLPLFLFSLAKQMVLVISIIDPLFLTFLNSRLSRHEFLNPQRLENPFIVGYFN